MIRQPLTPDWRPFPAVAALAALLAYAPVQAQQTSEPDAADALRSLQRELGKRDELIRQLLTRIDQLENRVIRIEAAQGPTPPATAVQAAAPGTAAGPLVVREPKGQAERLATPAPAALPGPVAESDRLIRAAFEQKLIERGGLLLPPRAYVLEPSISYQHSSADNILIDGFTILPVLVVGDIVSQRLRRDQVSAALTARFGLPADSQLEVRVPYAYQVRKTFSADGEASIVDNSGVGDVELSLSHQLYKSRGAWPDVLGSLRWKTTTGKSPFTAGSDKLVTGTGYNSLNLSFTTVKVVDPVVYFGGFGYTYNAATTQSAGRFNPGDGFGFNLGLAVALNLNSSLSFTYDQQFAGRSKLNGQVVPGSYLTTGVFSVGGSYSLGNDLTVDASLGIGVTRDSPDVLFRLSFPIRSRF